MSCFYDTNVVVRWPQKAASVKLPHIPGYENLYTYTRQPDYIGIFYFFFSDEEIFRPDNQTFGIVVEHLYNQNKSGFFDFRPHFHAAYLTQDRLNYALLNNSISGLDQNLVVVNYLYSGGHYNTLLYPDMDSHGRYIPDNVDQIIVPQYPEFPEE